MMHYSFLFFYYQFYLSVFVKHYHRESFQIQRRYTSISTINDGDCLLYLREWV